MVIAATVGSAVVGGVVSSKASKKASKTQAAASDRATAAQQDAQRESNALQLKIFNKQTANQEPWRLAGVEALKDMTPLSDPNSTFAQRFAMKDFTADPGYQFRIDQGTKAIERSSAARGGLFSGRTGIALQQRGQNEASAEYGNAYNRFNNDKNTVWNRLSGLAGVGQTATAQVNSDAGTYAGNVGSGMTAMGNAIGANQIANGQANAANSINQGNIWNKALSQGVNAIATNFNTPAVINGPTGAIPQTVSQNLTNYGSWF